MTAKKEPTPWAIAKAVYTEARSFEVAYDRSTWMPAYEAWQADGTVIPTDVDAEMERLQEIRCKAEDALYETPADSFAAIALKIELGRKRWVDFSTPESLWDALEDDLTNLQAQFAEAWLARFAENGGSVHRQPDGGVQFGVLMYDMTPVYRAFQADDKARKLGEDQYSWRDGHHHGCMNTMIDNLRFLPGGADIIKQHMADLGETLRYTPSGDEKIDAVARAVVETAKDAAERRA